MTDEAAEKKIDEIKDMLKAFSAQHLNDELHGYCIKLLEKISRKRTLSITKGKREIWAASIIYVIARLNFLFDKASKKFLTVDTVCVFFGCSKSTIGNKATEIEKACKIKMGDVDFCSPDISDALTIVRLPGGMVATKEMLKRWESSQPINSVYEIADPETEKEILAFQAQKEQQREAEEQKRIERRAEINRLIAAEKKKKQKKSQLSLFNAD